MPDQELDTVQVPKNMFIRMSKALISMEKFLEEKKDEAWVSEEKALTLLGCSKRTLARIKGKHIRFKRTGKKHQYSRSSIEEYNEFMSA